MSEVEEIAKKYGVPEEALKEVLEKAKNNMVPPPPERRLPVTDDGAFEGLPTSLLSALKSGSGDISMVEMIFLMDYLDRKEERRRERQETRAPSRDDSTSKLIEEMREQRHLTEKALMEQKSYVEQLLLGNKLKETEQKLSEYERARQADNQIMDQQSKENQAMAYYTQKLEQIIGGAQRLGPQQQTDFLTDILTEVGGEVKQEFKEKLIKAVRGEIPASTVTPKGGIAQNYWSLAERALGVLEKYATRTEPTPPMREVPQRMPPPPMGVQPESPPVPFPTTSPDTAPPSNRPEEASYEKTLPENLPEVQVQPATIYGVGSGGVNPVEVIHETGQPPITQEALTPSPPPNQIANMPTYVNPVEALNIRKVEPPEQKTLTQITDVKGIGPKWAAELEEAGINSVEALARQDPTDLATKLEIPLERASDWIDQAKDLV